MDDNGKHGPEGELFDRLYRLMLGLYPADFREQFGEEMGTTFADARSGARTDGRAAEARVLVRELLAFPGSLLRAHRRGWQTLQPQPVAGPRWPWVAGWTIVGGAGIPIAWLLAAPLAMLFLFLSRLSGAPSPLSSNMATMLGFVTGLGLTSAAIQWFLLRRQLPHAGWWIPLTLAGWFAAGLLIFTLDRLFRLWLQAPLTGFVLLGATVGIAQWLLLRQLLPHAAWWPLLTLLAFSTYLLVGRAITSLAELLFFLTFPHLILGTALWVLLHQAATPAPAPPKRSPRLARSWRRVAALGMLLLLPLLIVGPCAYATAQLELAKREGIYASPEEGFRIRAAAVEGAQLLRIEDLESGPSRDDGRLPHVGFAAGRVYYDRPPAGWKRSSGYPGDYYIRVRGGWVQMNEGAFPPLVGRLMEIYHLEGAGEE